MKKQIQNKKNKKTLKQTIYKFFPKKIKEQIENPYYREFLELGPEKRREKLKHLNPIIFFVLVRYCYFYCLLAIFFDKNTKK